MGLDLKTIPKSDWGQISWLRFPPSKAINSEGPMEFGLYTGIRLSKNQSH